MAPATVHYGLAGQATEKRQQVLQAAYERHPERFVKGVPVPPQLPGEVWINPPVTVSQGAALISRSQRLSLLPAITSQPSGTQRFSHDCQESICMKSRVPVTLARENSPSPGQDFSGGGNESNFFCLATPTRRS